MYPWSCKQLLAALCTPGSSKSTVLLAAGLPRAIRTLGAWTPRLSSNVRAASAGSCMSQVSSRRAGISCELVKGRRWDVRYRSSRQSTPTPDDDNDRSPETLPLRVATDCSPVWAAQSLDRRPFGSSEGNKQLPINAPASGTEPRCPKIPRFLSSFPHAEAAACFRPSREPPPPPSVVDGHDITASYYSITQYPPWFGRL